MKEKLTDEIKDIFVQGRDWIKLEIEYAKLTVAEKFTLLLSAMIIGAICLLMGMVVLILLSFALVELFKNDDSSSSCISGCKRYHLSVDIGVVSVAESPVVESYRAVYHKVANK